MKLYKSYLSIQQNGSIVYLILRSATKEGLEQSFNSLYNFGATDSQGPTYHSSGNVNVIATCMSSWHKLQHYFYLRHKFKFNDHNKAYLDSLNNINELKKEQNNEVFFKLQNERKIVVNDGFEFGKLDNYQGDDIKDAIVLESFKDKKLLPAPITSSGETVGNNGVFPEVKNINTLMTVVEL